jgi:hypothetical protein
MAVLTLFSSQLFQESAHNDHIISHSVSDNVSSWNSIDKDRKRTCCSSRTEPCRFPAEEAPWSNRRTVTYLVVLVGACEQQFVGYLLALFLALKMEVLRSSEMWVNLYETVRCHIPEDRMLHIYLRESFLSHVCRVGQCQGLRHHPEHNSKADLFTVFSLGTRDSAQCLLLN